MAHSSSRTHTTVAPPGTEPDGWHGVMCPMCHTPTSLTQHAVETGGDWRCVRCGQYWDAVRLAAVAAYAEWTLDRDRAVRRDPEGSQGRP